MQLVLHAPFGGRINRAWGLARRKCFCRTFDFELQAAATDDGILLSLGEQHSFPLEAAFSFVREATLREALTQAILQSPIFETRWRHNAGRALAVLRHSGWCRVPANIQRMRAADLLAAVFPEQVGCQDNHHGEITPPDHPYVNETLHMSLVGLRDMSVMETPPYAFLDDAPLEERRARAVSLRRTDPDLARGIVALDAAAIEAVRTSVQPDLRDADEVHDHLLTIGILPDEVAEPWRAHLEDLRRRGRAVYATWSTPSGEARRGTVAVERMAWVRAAMDGIVFDGDPAPPGCVAPPASAEDAFRSIVCGWMQTAGPVTAAALAAQLGWASSPHWRRPARALAVGRWAL